MNLLSKIQQQDLKAAQEIQKLINLQRKYVEQNAIYHKGDIVKFYKYNWSEKPSLGKVLSARYEETTKGLIVYIIKSVTKDFKPHGKDKAFHRVGKARIIEKIK